MRKRGLMRAAVGAGVAMTLGLFTVSVLADDARDDNDGPAWSAHCCDPVGKDWPTVGGNYGNTHYSGLSQINRKNLAELGGAWLTHLEGGAQVSNQQSNPIVVNGTMYIQTAQQDIFAIDAKTGAMKWKYNGCDTATGTGCSFNLRGVAVAEGKVFSSLIDSRVVALDEQTGKQLWIQTLQPSINVDPYCTAATSPSCQIRQLPAAVVYYKGLLYIGMAGCDGPSRGRAFALKASDGTKVWQFWGVPATGEFGNDTWSGTDPNTNQPSWTVGGACPWMQPAIDAETNTLYWTFGSANPNDDGTNRPGNNLFSGSIVAVDAMTGAYKWHYQMTHHDLWDYDMVMAPLLFDVRIHGQHRKAVAIAGKTGYLYIFDRTTGQPLIGIDETPVAQDATNHTAATQPIPRGDPFTPVCPSDKDATRAVPNYDFGVTFKTGTYDGCIFYPFDNVVPLGKNSPGVQPNGTGGGADWGYISFNPKRNLIFVPAGMVNSAFGINERFFRPLGEMKSGMLTALDARTNKIVWQDPNEWALGHNSSLATAGDLVFLGQPDGYFVAFDARNGKELWRWQTGAGVHGGIVSYEIDGDQYVAVLAGGNGLEYNSPPGDYLWAFKLGGSVPQAATPVPPPTRQPITATAVTGAVANNTVVLGRTWNTTTNAPSTTEAPLPNQNAMAPQNLSVPVGTTVIFTNPGTNAIEHCATQFFEGLFAYNLAPGKSMSYTFTKPGEYFYNDCHGQSENTGKIVVN
jgi:glucose dehydrogenase/plastocyanin